MPDYMITPKAPLIFGDGKPFGTADNIADTLAFPMPSTIAGAMRTAWAESQADGFNYAEDAPKLTKKRVLGPLLTRTCTQTHKTEVLFPTPADSLCLNHESEGKKIHRLYPDTLNADEGTDLPYPLLPVFLESDNKSKPASNAPKFWDQKAITHWLMGENEKVFACQQTANLPIETRSHVAINPDTQSHRSSHLFQTAGLDFNPAQKPRDQPPKQDQLGWQPHEYGLLTWFQEDMPDSYRTLGGETRLGHIRQQHALWPECPSDLSQALGRCTSFRLIFATPAIFNQGYLPEWLDQDLKGTLGTLQIQLRAVSLQRWQASTRWDMADPKSKQGKGMRTARRLIPAGSVYWFDIIKGHAAELQEHWLTSVSDQGEQDGFGLILPGIWTKTNPLKESL